MLNDLAALHSKEIIVGSGRFGPCFHYSEYEIAFCHIATRHEDSCATGLCDLGNPCFHARNPVAYFRGMLDVMIAVDEFIDTIKTQFNRHDLLKGTNESAIRFSSFPINNGS